MSEVAVEWEKSNVRRRYGKGGIDCLNLETMGNDRTMYLYCEN